MLEVVSLQVEAGRGSEAGPRLLSALAPRPSSPRREPSQPTSQPRYVLLLGEANAVCAAGSTRRYLANCQLAAKQVLLPSCALPFGLARGQAARLGAPRARRATERETGSAARTACVAAGLDRATQRPSERASCDSSGLPAGCARSAFVTRGCSPDRQPAGSQLQPLASSGRKQAAAGYTHARDLLLTASRRLASQPAGCETARSCLAGWRGGFST